MDHHVRMLGRSPVHDALQRPVSHCLVLPFDQAGVEGHGLRALRDAVQLLVRELGAGTQVLPLRPHARVPDEHKAGRPRSCRRQSLAPEAERVRGQVSGQLHLAHPHGEGERHGVGALRPQPDLRADNVRRRKGRASLAGRHHGPGDGQAPRAVDDVDDGEVPVADDAGRAQAGAEQGQEEARPPRGRHRRPRPRRGAPRGSGGAAAREASRLPAQGGA
mmetsp:Transcript_32098/g.84743  ORF Transcript_32098/g.84743 Transcript_32098/m.84743 type:complete len:219 (-) Transcript_32098:17-673(-)